MIPDCPANVNSLAITSPVDRDEGRAALLGNTLSVNTRLAKH
jgi:hypothetical protein